MAYGSDPVNQYASFEQATQDIQKLTPSPAIARDWATFVARLVAHDKLLTSADMALDVTSRARASADRRFSKDMWQSEN